MNLLLSPFSRAPSRQSRWSKHDPRRWDAGKSEGELAMETAATNEIEILLRVEIRDALALWQAAAQRLAHCRLDMEDIDETIGPVEDPLVEACVATLILPEGIAGCELLDIRLEQQPTTLPSSADQLDGHVPALAH